MFIRKSSVIGVVHVLPLPGSAGYTGNMQEIVRTALTDASTYKNNGIDALIIENMHDVPYLNGFVEPETTAAMAILANLIKQETKLPLGIQILAAANIEALGVAVAASLDFIRVEGFVFAHVGDEGIHQASAPKLLRRRAALNAQGIKIFADIKKKHCAHAITADVSLVETARAAQFFQADGVIVSGAETGIAPPPQDVASVREATTASVLVGSGVTVENVNQFLPYADALIVGSSLKYDGLWSKPVDPGRVKELMRVIEKQTAKSARSQ